MKPDDTPVERNVLPCHSDVTATDLSIANQSASHEFCRVDRNRETDALSRQNHGRIDADDFAAGVNQRPAAIAGIQGGIGLDDIVHQTPRVGSQRPAQGTDYASRNRALTSVRIPDGDRKVPYADFLRVSKESGHRTRRIDSNHSEVRIRVVANELCVKSVAIKQGDNDLAGIVNDVAVSKNESVGSKDKSRTTAHPRVSVASTSIVVVVLLNADVHN